MKRSRFTMEHTSTWYRLWIANEPTAQRGETLHDVRLCTLDQTAHGLARKPGLPDMPGGSCTQRGVRRPEVSDPNSGRSDLDEFRYQPERGWAATNRVRSVCRRPVALWTSAGGTATDEQMQP